MRVLRDRKTGHLAVDAPPQYHGNLAGQVDPLFEHADFATDLIKGSGEIVEMFANYLSLAVVSKRGRFQNGRKSKITRRIQVGFGFDREIFRGAETLRTEKVFFALTMLGYLQRIRRGMHRHRFRQILQGGRRHVFELGRDYRAVLRQVVECRGIVVGPGQMLAGKPAGRTVRIRIEHDYVITHRARGGDEHAAKLAAAEHSESSWGQDRHISPAVAASWRAPCRAACRGSFAASLPVHRRTGPVSMWRTTRR